MYIKTTNEIGKVVKCALRLALSCFPAIGRACVCAIGLWIAYITVFPAAVPYVYFLTEYSPIRFFPFSLVSSVRTLTWTISHHRGQHHLDHSLTYVHIIIFTQGLIDMTWQRDDDDDGCWRSGVHVAAVATTLSRRHSGLSYSFTLHFQPLFLLNAFWVGYNEVDAGGNSI